MSLAAHAVATNSMRTCFACVDGSFIVACCSALAGCYAHGGAGGASEGSDRTRVDGAWCCPIAFPAPASARLPPLRERCRGALAPNGPETKSEAGAPSAAERRCHGCPDCWARAPRGERVDGPRRRARAPGLIYRGLE